MVPSWITLLHFDDRINEISARPLRTGLPTAIRNSYASTPGYFFSGVVVASGSEYSPSIWVSSVPPATPEPL